MNGQRPNGIRQLAYKVRPLDGIWATLPYLHNGSVPTVCDLLSPVAERPKTFYTGGRESDPVKLGLKTDTAPVSRSLIHPNRATGISGMRFRHARPGCHRLVCSPMNAKPSSNI